MTHRIYPYTGADDGIKYPNIEVEYPATMDMYGNCNAYDILAPVIKALRAADVPKAEIEAYTTEAKAGDYDNLLDVTEHMVFMVDDVNA